MERQRLPIDIEIPADLDYLFWDVPHEGLDSNKNADFIICRLLEYGTLKAVHWVLKTYGEERVKACLKGRGQKLLSAKTRNFWKLLFNLDDEECSNTFSPKTRNPFWSY